jgi:hypothetical protein
VVSLRLDEEEEEPVDGRGAVGNEAGKRSLERHGAVTSRKDFTQRQLMACLVLRAYLKTTYRGLIEILETSEALRTELGMKDKLPHYSTLPEYLQSQRYGLRWKIESYMSALKRTTGSTLLSRKPANLLKEAAFKVLAYALNR